MPAQPTAAPVVDADTGDAFAPGRHVDGRYVLIDRIGRGGSCTMWRARDEILCRDVAIKRLVGSPSWTAEQAEAARVRAHREGRVAARLHHPRLADIYDLTEVDGDVCLVMEYVDAPSLAWVVDDGGPLGVVEVARMGAQIAEGLSAAHASGVLHRDVKPANVLLGAGGATLTDFGVARLTGDPSTTATGLITGTPHFMAPEVARGAAADSASDVYSLGATLFAALEGHPPTGEGTNALETLRRVAAGRTVPARRAGALSPVLARLLDADPAGRPAIGEVAPLLRAAAGAASETEVVAPVPAPVAAASPHTLVDVPIAAQPAPAVATAEPWTAPVRPGPQRERGRRLAVGSLLGAAGVVGVLGGVVALTTTATTTPVVASGAVSPAPTVNAPTVNPPVVPPSAPASAPPIVPAPDPAPDAALDLGPSTLSVAPPSLAAAPSPAADTSSGSSDGDGFGDGFGGGSDDGSGAGFMTGGGFGDGSGGSDHSDDGGHHGGHHGGKHRADKGSDDDSGQNSGRDSGKNAGKDSGKDSHHGSGKDHGGHGKGHGHH